MTPPPLDVTILMLPGQVPLDLAGPVQVFTCARHHAPDLALRFIGPQESIEWLDSLTLSGITPMPDVLETDLLVVPGQYTCQISHLHQQDCVAWLSRQRHVKTIMAICSGALLLGRAGLLNGRRCTTHHRLRQTLRQLTPDALVQEDCIFIEDGPVLTSAGISTGIDTALYWVQAHLGASVALAVAREMVLYARRSGQEPQLGVRLEGRNHVSERLHRLQDDICNAISAVWTLPVMADKAAISSRQLHRLFIDHIGCTPHAWLTHLRLGEARQLLLETRHGIDTIAEQVGMETRQFRRQWTHVHGLSPSQWRRRATATHTGH
ncbi:GlxA family transcriptional regulator [Larsenimonas rhizosphaerae]|uniref:Helix-turn-helix domain-containing protein n=1 Tax=Larsenimonas rhizosphaerae TaxID=2944682 RepID=A0AA41ZG75_9GAMM|nr:helix-turn-helix domain-containing protein [Larsenimonas rhizosphaerae]MCX2524717.1 helix-turn-helix domain-containing protein [Larsenimonas rhizosphaerae]